ncbi:MAG: TolC family protein [Acidobacteria bacterium]|nr:TolC family protein [Acidobacteriota bacterium]
MAAVYRNILDHIWTPLAGVAVTFVLALSVVAQTPTPSPTIDLPPPVQPSFVSAPRPTPDPSRVGVDGGDPWSLTIEQAIDLALTNNNDIDVSRNNVRINDYNLQAAKGIYDPLFSSQTYYESRTTPTASTIGGAVGGSVTQRQFYNDFGFSGFTPKFGGQYDLLFNQARTTTTNRNTTLNPQYPTNMIASYTQPLWRGLRIDANRRNIMIAAKNVSITESQLRQVAMTQIRSVEQAYWDLVYALRNLQVQNDTLRQAQDQLESNKRLVEKGVLAPIEVVAANAQISTYEQAIYAAQESVTRDENTLKTILLPDRRAPEWSRPIMPVTDMNREVPRIGLEVATSEAMKNRPEIEQLGISKDINQIDQRYYKDLTKPQVNLVGSYTSAGLAGTPNPNSSGFATVPDVLKGGYFNSLRNLYAQDFPTYRLGVQIALPIRNRTAKANFARVQVEGDRIANNRAQEEQLIEAEVRNALQALRSAEATLASATAAREAAEELYSSEQRQFRAGTTTFFLVLQRQTELSAARGREIQARTNLNKAISEFNHSIGATLNVNNVSVGK